MGNILQEKGKNIIERCLCISSTNVYEIFLELTSLDCVCIHGPEHHILDGACILTAYKNAGGDLDLKSALDMLLERGLKMPGAMCGQWGVCGAATSVGAALAIIDQTGPLSVSDWGEHMILTSQIVADMSKTGGPRCCKRDGLIALKNGMEYVAARYGVDVKWTEPTCGFYPQNEQCISERCPFYPKKKKKVAFICVHNSCRSQIAEALGKHLGAEIFDSYSAGTETKPQINQDAVRLMRKLYGIDMEKTQYSKLVSDIPQPDIAIAMGCNVGCTYIGSAFDDDWGLDDPTGKSDEAFLAVIKQIEYNIRNLIKELQ